MNFDHPMTMMRLQKIIEVIQIKPMHAHEIAAAIFLSKRWVPKYLEYLCNTKRAHIKAWVRYGKHEYMIPMYAFGEGRNAHKPYALTSAEKARLLRERLNADPERRDIHIARDRARKRKPQAQMDPVMAAFFGMSTR